MEVFDFVPWPAYRAMLETMEEPFPEWPALLFDFVLPSRPKDLFLNLWIADPHGATPTSASLENPNRSCKVDPYVVFCGRENNYCKRPSRSRLVCAPPYSGKGQLRQFRAGPRPIRDASEPLPLE